MQKAAISIEGLGKKYRIWHNSREKYQTVRESLTRKLAHCFQTAGMPRSATQDFWALKDVTLEIGRGECVGIIGRNGAGKSTLLKLLSRITEPTEGRIRLRGRVGSLLEVGTGFHQELTGRENIYLNGTILGMRKKEIDRKFDEIVAFAEIEEFLDTPVKRYSSGMHMRLAFAVAAYLEPEILVVDEVLAVGDAMFQRKCLGKMQDVNQKEGRTVLFVSHNMPMVASLCSRAVLLDNGKLREDGPSATVIMKYYNSGEYSSAYYDAVEIGKNIGDEYALFLRGWVEDSKGDKASEVEISEPFVIKVVYRVSEQGAGKAFVPNFHFYNAEGVYTFVSGGCFDVQPTGTFEATCHVPGNLLNDGAYSVGLALSSFDSGVKVHFYERNCLSFNVRDPLVGVKTRHPGYSGRIPGVVRPHLQWDIRRLV